MFTKSGKSIEKVESREPKMKTKTKLKTINDK